MARQRPLRPVGQGPCKGGRRGGLRVCQHCLHALALPRALAPQHLALQRAVGLAQGPQLERLHARSHAQRQALQEGPGGCAAAHPQGHPQQERAHANGLRSSGGGGGVGEGAAHGAVGCEEPQGRDGQQRCKALCQQRQRQGVGEEAPKVRSGGGRAPRGGAGLPAHLPRHQPEHAH